MTVAHGINCNPAHDRPPIAAQVFDASHVDDGAGGGDPDDGEKVVSSFGSDRVPRAESARKLAVPSKSRTLPLPSMYLNVSASPLLLAYIVRKNASAPVCSPMKTGVAEISVAPRSSPLTKAAIVPDVAYVRGIRPTSTTAVRAMSFSR